MSDEYFYRHNAVVRDEWDSINAIKEFIRVGKWDAAWECWDELDRDTKMILWKAPKYGGIWTTDERTAIRGARPKTGD